MVRLLCFLFPIVDFGKSGERRWQVVNRKVTFRIVECMTALLLIDVTYVIIALSAKSDLLLTCIALYSISCCFINQLFNIPNQSSNPLRI